jgi:hypothetical protein
MSEDFISGLHADLVEAMDRYERRSPRGRLAVGGFPRLLRPATLARVAAGAALIVALVAAVVTVWRESDVEQPAAPPGKKVVATDVERGVRFSLDGRVLTVQLLEPVRNQTFEAVSGAEISATCGANVAAPPGDPRSEITLFRRWPAGQTSLSFRFPRDVASWCLLRDQSGGIVAMVSFPAASSGASGPIAETADKWARHFASSPWTCTDYMSRNACKLVTECERVGRTQIPACRAKNRQWAAAFLGATVQAIAIRGDRAAATLSNDVIVQLRRTTTGEWQIDGMGPFGAVGPDAAAQRRSNEGS